MVKINELLKMIEAQEKAGGESCTPGTELELGENIVDSYGKVTFYKLNNSVKIRIDLIDLKLMSYIAFLEPVALDDNNV